MDSYPERQKWNRRITWGFVLFAGISAVTTFRGVQMYGLSGGDDFFNHYLGPALLTSASMVLSLLGWKYVLDRFVHARTPQEKSRMYFIIGFVCVMLLSTSTGFSIIGLSAERCLKKSYRTSLTQVEKSFDELIAVRKMEKALLTPLELGAGQANVLAKSEVLGAISGRAGNRKVAANIRGLKHGFEDIARTLKSSIRKHEATAEQAQLIIQEIRNIILDDAIKVEDKSSLLAPLYNDLNAQATDLSISAVPAVVGFVNSIDEVYLSKASYMDSIRDAIQEPIDRCKQEILNQVQNIKKKKEPKVPRFYVLDAQESILAFPETAWSSVVYSVSLDIGFQLMCLAFIVNLSRGESSASVTTGRSMSHGFSETFGRTAGGVEPHAGYESLWNTYKPGSRKSNKPRQNSGNEPESPVA